MQTQKDIQNNRHVLVIGGGVGGIRAALDLADSCRNVVLIDTAFAIGGLMTRLDRTEWSYVRKIFSEMEEEAAGILASCFEGREVVPLPARGLVYGYGGIHCVSQQEPEEG